MTQSLAELEQLCNVLYNSHDPNERAHAENVLTPFSTNVDYIPQCKVRRSRRRLARDRIVRPHPLRPRRDSLSIGGRASLSLARAPLVRIDRAPAGESLSPDHPPLFPHASTDSPTPSLPLPFSLLPPGDPRRRVEPVRASLRDVVSDEAVDG